MKNTLIAVIVLLFASSCVGSSGGIAPKVRSAPPVTTEVFIVYDDASYPPSDAYRTWVSNNDVPRELMIRMPVSFTNKGGRVTLALDESVSGFRELGRIHVGTDPDIERISCEFPVGPDKGAGKPRTVSFSADKLRGESGKVASQAGEYALFQAIRSSGAVSGKAWVRFVSCANGVFSVEVMIR